METTSTRIARAEAVGSLLRPKALLEARAAADAGSITTAALRAEEDDAILEAIALQEEVGLDVITDGEMRRSGWAETPTILDCFERLPGPRAYPATARWASPESFLTVVRKVGGSERRDVVEDEYGFLVDHATSRSKFTIAAPSYHRRYWSDEHSTAAYERVEDYLSDVRDWMRGLVARLADRGCTYVQLDAPNYGSLCDPETRDFHASVGHDVAADVAFDAHLDSSVFEGIDGVTRALHVCRGNTPGGGWHSSGGYAAIAEDLFPNLDLDVVLLEYDSDRTGDFAPLAAIPAHTVAVVGLVTTKSGEVEADGDVLRRLEEATAAKPVEQLAVSTQCGFASVPGDNPVGPVEQRQKLELVTHVARRIWG